MGTSTGYKMPTGGAWKPLKDEATRFVKGGGGGPSPEKVLSNYAKALRNLSGFLSSDGGGGGGGGQTPGGGVTLTLSSGAARVVGQGLGDFFTSVETVGLNQALRDFGLSDFAGQDASHIANAIVDRLAGEASTIDDQTARHACEDLKKELLSNTKTAEDVEIALKTQLDEKGLGGLLMSYFGFYIFRCFQRDFYEVWLAKVGAPQAKSQLDRVEKFIRSCLKNKMLNKDISAFDWRGQDGNQLISRILRDTCDVFDIGGRSQGESA